jgi:hypothetical protein
MTEYALLIDGVFKEIRRYESQPVDIPHKLATWHAVSRSSKPDSTLTQNPAEQWALLDNVWTQSWTMVDVSAEEAARRQQRANDLAHREAIKIDSFVKNFITMTPDQVTNYVTNNTNNLAEVRALLHKMALMLLALARREYR